MPIQFFSAVRGRSRFGLADEAPTAKARRLMPGYELYRFDEAVLGEPGTLATTAAVLFRQSAKHPRRISRQLRVLAPPLLWHGCLVFVQPLPTTHGSSAQFFRRYFVEAVDEMQLPVSGLTDEEFSGLGQWFTRANRPMTPLVHVLERPDDWQSVQWYLQLHLPGEGATPGPGVVHLDADGREGKLGPEQTLLVQRAFGGAAEVRLEQLRNGLSGVDAYRAYVQHNGVAGSQYPYRYFVKIGPRNKIATEYLGYRDVAMEHLPYHLGPRLRLERCALAHVNGILVSDYVSGAEPLRDCARDGRAAGVIANLFNVTYRGWHNGARSVDARLQDHLQHRVPLAIPLHRQPLIADYGATRTLDELRSLLLTGDSRPYSGGVIHGDLHATNVLVRGGDAILIDFEKIEPEGPVLRDVACLEGGLFVDGFVGDRRNPTELLASVRCLYTNDVLRGDGRITHCQPDDGSAWFFDCVMQLRMQARQFRLAPNQYALVLASELLRKACNDHDFAKDRPANEGSDGHSRPPRLRMEQTRAMAYVLAEWILSELSDGGQFRPVTR